MAIYVYKTATGVLASYCPNDTDPVASAGTLAANGLTAVSGLAPLDSTHQWDPATKTVITVTAPTAANMVRTFDFIMAFTPAELAAIRASSDTSIQRFLFALQVTGGVNLNNGTIQNSLNYLVTNAFLTSARANAILATISSGAGST